MSIVMTGGGTGGHLAIIRAVKEQLAVHPNAQRVKDSHGESCQNSSLLTPHSSLIYIGSQHGQDRQWFEGDRDFAATYFLETRGVVNQGTLGKIMSIGMLAKATVQTIRLLRKHHARVVFSVGGYSAAATAFAAKLLRIPLVIHEQNAALGSLNKMLKPYADVFLSSYETDSPVTAYPVQQIFFETARIRNRVNTVIFLGGSQGAQAINRLALSLAPELQKRGIAILHQAGERNLETVRQAYGELGIEAEIFGFTTELPAWMARADLAIARAGASTLWELAANGLPTLFVPYPYAAGDHQYHNARFLADQGAAWVRREDALEPEEVLRLLAASELPSMSRKLMALSDPKGAQQIAALLEQYVPVV